MAVTRPPRAILFDWDGTLVDTAEPSYRCYVRMFERFGIPFDRETYARTYSPNWYHTFRCLGLPEEKWDEADQCWLEAFADERVELIPGAREAVVMLAERGVAVGIVTSGSRGRVLREIAGLGLDRHVHESVFGTDVIEKKPHPEALLLCLERMRIAPHESAYVGDSPEDVAMARAAGVLAVAVPGTYPNREALVAAGADLFVETVLEAVGVLLGDCAQ